MARPKKFDRESLLEKAIPVFWRHGLAGTSVQHLERATGVNKSGLYSEFSSKEEIFVAALRHYLDSSRARKILDREPLGWKNIEDFLLTAPFNTPNHAGCFSINSTRDVAELPPEAVALISEFNRNRMRSIARNIRAEHPALDVDAVCDLITTFFSGVCIDANLTSDPAAHEQKVSNLMKILKKL